jgi:hypothetical protein
MINSLKNSKKKDDTKNFKDFLHNENLTLENYKLASTRFTNESTKASHKSPQTLSTSNKSPQNIGYVLSEGSKKSETPSLSLNMFRTNEEMKALSNMTDSVSSFTDNGKSFLIIVKVLESMISEIKLKGFNRIRQEIEDKTQDAKILQNNVSSLENSLRIVRNHTKNCGQSNDILLKENDKMMIAGDVSKF